MSTETSINNEKNTHENIKVNPYFIFANDLFHQLKELSHDGVGITRASYSETETLALNMLKEFAESHGLFVQIDPAQNYIFSIKEYHESQDYRLIGSHIDSVPEGGNYDGAAGIISGILCLVRAKKEQITFKTPVKVIALRGEESAWFGHCYLGSKAIFGQLNNDILQAKHRDTGKELEIYMKAVGVDLPLLKQGKVLLNKNRIKEYLEVHIEQGPVLVERNKPIAIVSGIRGNIRYQSIHCLGEAGHSGAVPREYRHDAVFSVANLLVRLDDHWKTLNSHNSDLVLTSGIMSTNQHEHAISRIPGDVTFSFEARSEYPDILKTVENILKSEAQSIERERNVKFQFDKKISSRPALLDNKIAENLKLSAIKCGLEPFVTPSGAGHDAAIFVNEGIPAGMIFIRNQHGSHNPYEEMDLSDMLEANEVLYHYLKNH